MTIWRFLARNDEDIALYDRVKKLCKDNGTNVTFLTKKLWERAIKEGNGES